MSWNQSYRLRSSQFANGLQHRIRAVAFANESILSCNAFLGYFDAGYHENRNVGLVCLHRIGDQPKLGLAVENNGASRIVDLRVSPFKTPVQDKVFYLIAFETPTGTEVPRPETVLTPLSDDERTLKDKQIAQLKQEVAATKEYLQSIIEGEATNEELQSANEEIQSGNEELHTVNEEMQHRNEQLNQLNNDLNNLLNSVNLPMVMVGPELNIRRFTSQASKVLGLAASDVGRPITRLRLKLVDAGDLEETMLNVIAEVRPSHQRLKDAEGRCCELRVTPYRTSDNRIDGVGSERAHAGRHKPGRHGCAGRWW